jgi:hypothetical protein
MYGRASRRRLNSLIRFTQNAGRVSDRRFVFGCTSAFTVSVLSCGGTPSPRGESRAATKTGEEGAAVHGPDHGMLRGRAGRRGEKMNGLERGIRRRRQDGARLQRVTIRLCYRFQRPATLTLLAAFQRLDAVFPTPPFVWTRATVVRVSTTSSRRSRITGPAPAHRRCPPLA